MNLFETASIGRIKLKNRIIRSATIMKMCDSNGFPGEKYNTYHHELAKNGPGLIITGFSYISKQGRSMHTGQAGLDKDEKVKAFKKTVDIVHAQGCPIIIQLAHTGRQTSSIMTGEKVLGVSAKKSIYFNEPPKVVTTKKAVSIIREFANSALLAKQAGFDGIQLHAAHGYLIHQFILPSVNKRKDRYGINPDTGIGTGFLDETIEEIRKLCGKDFPIMIKVSAGDDYKPTFREDQFINLITFLDKKKVSAIEISYGTMDYALNIFRGKSIPFNTILKHNPRYKIKNRIIKTLWKKTAGLYLSKKLKPFTPMYNLPYAHIAKKYTDIPIICVGGFKSGYEIKNSLSAHNTDFISLSRPLLCEPDFILKLKKDENYISQCTSCNICAVMVDSPFPTACYRKG